MKRTLRTFALIGVATLGLTASANAGPGTMVMMLHGKMVMVTPLDHDVTYANGTKVLTNGTVMMKGKKTHLAEGEGISAAGVLMRPAATKAHGG